MAGLGIILLSFFIYRLHKVDLNVTLTLIQIHDRKQIAVWGLDLAIIILSIIGMISWHMAFMVTMAAVLIFNISLLKKVDYLLLLTFICFFVFIGNLSSSDLVQTFASKSLNDAVSVYFGSIFVSQVISNVPASILLSHFTTEWKALLLGVNIGGLGTIIASMASVISYKLFIQSNPKEGRTYLKHFTVYNFFCLVFLSLAQFAIFKLLKFI